MKLIGLLIGLIDLAPGRILAALGMGFISFGAITVVLNQLISHFTSAWGGLGGASLQIASLAGFPVAMGVVIGALITRASLSAIPKLGKIS